MAPASVGFTEPELVLKKFGQLAGGWRVNRHPRCAADTTGDRRADIVGFGGDGVWVAWARKGGGFDKPQLVLKAFGYNAGWRLPNHPRLLADTTGDGRADIVGFHDDGVWVAEALASGGFKSPQLVLKHFGRSAAAGGWEGRHLRVLADTNGDGRADILGFGNAGVWVSKAKKGGGFAEPKLVHDQYGADGWPTHWARAVGDTNGDRRADIVGFGHDRVVLTRGTGSGFGDGTIVLKNQFGYSDEAGAWRVERHPRHLADVSGDGRADIVGFGNDGVWVGRANAKGGFDPPQLAMKKFGYAAHAGSWRTELHVRCLADTTGDGRADIVGFGDAGVYVSRSG